MGCHSFFVLTGTTGIAASHRVAAPFWFPLH